MGLAVDPLSSHTILFLLGEIAAGVEHWMRVETGDVNHIERGLSLFSE